MEEERDTRTVVSTCLGTGAGWVAFCLTLGLLKGATYNTGVPNHILAFYLYLRDIQPEPYDFTAVVVAESATYCFVSLPAFLVGLTIYDRCIAGIRTFSMKSVLVTIAFVAAILGMSVGDPVLATERWRAALGVVLFIVVFTAFLFWARTKRHHVQ
jgi:uncharacterized membrane protein